MYGETNLGATDDAVVLYLKSPMNKNLLDALKKHVYPEFAAHFAAAEAKTETEKTNVEEPPVNPVIKKKTSSK